ncbi:hypothetical protein K435DRAFT_782464 [Dendrothele bispora CBS 962.96]|uniref:Uncharacterized protein n=1 Tax=Dendrothele bispora (strain CBS 962.96) TaxID=1314807 RepID=A0A4V4HDL1_DENBC|nr:hypothetical protein K435DRAFT_782464 [Dendrothele bispora CBS 962.96]
MAETTKHSSNGASITSDIDDLQGNASESKANQEQASYQPHYASPPPVKVPYDPNEALDDIPGVSYALELSLASKMIESEDYCNQNDEKKERLYFATLGTIFATGYGLIQCVKGLMSYEDVDLLSGIEHTKQGNLIATKHRKKAASITSPLAGIVISSLNSHGVGFIKSMTDVERHAELVYAESLFEKALLGIVYSGDWLAFIKEALNMRTTISVYRNLLKYVNTMDAESLANGVYLGAGMATLILSLLPQKLLVIVELFGYKGDRKEALDLLCRAGGWSADNSEPAISTGKTVIISLESQEGVPFAIHMALLVFHLVLSSFTFDGVDVSMAQKIIDWNLKRYPDGVFFLFGAGRLSLVRSQPRRAIGFYTRAMEVQSQYRNLHHHYLTVCLNDSLEAWKILQEATWSKAIYSYGMAVCLLELADIEDRGEKDEKKVGPSSKEMREQAIKLMEQVPNLRQKIAGKSIPLEKLVARKARKFIAQGGRLTLPALELAYLFLGIAHAPRKTVQEAKMLAEVRRARVLLDKAGSDPKKYLDGKGDYWDDLCLVDFLEGICLRYIAYPDPDAELDLSAMSQEEADKASEEAFNAVLKNGPMIELDHFLVYNAHYELGRLYACRGDTTAAKMHFDLVLSGKYLEVGPSGKKGKYSLEISFLLMIVLS